MELMFFIDYCSDKVIYSRLHTTVIYLDSVPTSYTTDYLVIELCI
jgi:hypothetical protein